MSPAFEKKVNELRSDIAIVEEVVESINSVSSVYAIYVGNHFVELGDDLGAKVHALIKDEFEKALSDARVEFVNLKPNAIDEVSDADPEQLAAIALKLDKVRSSYQSTINPLC